MNRRTSSTASALRCLTRHAMSLLVASSFTATAATKVDFNRDVQPILSGHCFKCHGPDAEKRKANLRLDVRDGALKPAKSGDLPIVPDHPEESALVRRIFSKDDDEQMPPPAAHLALSEEQKETLKQWIAAGAVYEPHWSFVKPVQPEPPAVQETNWPKNPIDDFVLARMEAAGLKPSERADKYTLVRRVYLDLIGLPPTPEQADAFVNDPSPDAYEHLVDDLLASPHYGERWTRRWLDLARYADTNGYEKDRPRSIWPYRDWVINAYNSGMPFDQFTIDQMAGDILAAKLPKDDPRRLPLEIATGFNRNSMINEEGGTDPQEYRYYSMVDRVRVTSTTWLGLTMACAQCHTHKYDPILHKEYYQFMALMNNADEPRIDVPQPDITKKRDAQEAKIKELESKLIDEFPPELKADWITPAIAEFKSEAGNKAEHLSDGSFLVEGDAADKDTYTITLDSSLDQIGHLQVLALPDQSLAKNGPGRSDGGNFVLSEIEITAAPVNEPTNTIPVKLVKARADGAQDKFPAWDTIDGKDNTGWGVDTGGDWHVARTLTVDFDKPTGFAGGTRFTIQLKQNYGGKHVMGRFRLSLGRDLPDGRPMPIRQRENLDMQLAKWLDKELPKAVAWTPITPVTAKGSYPTLNIEPDNVVFVSGDFTKSDTYTVGFKGDWKGVRAIRIEVLPDPRLPNNGPGRVNYEGTFGDFFMSDVKVFNGEQAVKIKSATDSFHSGDNDAAKALDDNMQSGWAIAGGQSRSHNAVFVFDQPLDFDGDLKLQMIFERYYASGLGKFRVWVTHDENAVAVPHPNNIQDDLLALKNHPDETDRVKIMARLRAHYVTIAPELSQELAQIDELKRDMPEYPTTLVMEERLPGHQRITHVHKRGEFLQPTDVVEPGVPSFLPDLPAGAPRNRLGFAEWLVSKDNPLTARVVMNRNWQAFFGRGIVRTVEDFGYQGDLPTHPKLLDWLACEFMNRGWSMKQMQKLIVMSATYQQSSRVTQDRLAKDPENLLLSRAPRFRLEAELVRDTGLVASGLFSDKMGGPSVFPPQLPTITTEGAYGPLKWTVSEGADRYRRGLYTFAKRTAPFAMFNAFDAPSGEACTAKRDRSNTPLQSLTLLNDEMFLEMARALGKQMAAQTGTVEERIVHLFRRCLTRPPTDKEINQLKSFEEAQLKRLASGDLNAKELLGTSEGKDLNEEAAWAAVARVLLNLDETITKS